ncbi:MAG: hypothetical protein K2P70_00380 [Hyphomonadaceae bacterium]|nr:hypothetical protein [Hyphomonadaceae bacterium]
MLRNALFALATLALITPAYAQDAETPAPAAEPAQAASETILSESVRLDIVDGSLIPEECHYPATISDTARFELACVTMPRFAGGQVAMEYIGQLGEQGFQQGSYITGGMTAVRANESNCQEVINIFPGDYPPGTRGSDIVVIWFARERAPRCPA